MGFLWLGSVQKMLSVCVAVLHCTSLLPSRVPRCPPSFSPSLPSNSLPPSDLTQPDGTEFFTLFLPLHHYSNAWLHSGTSEQR